LSKGFFLR